MYIKTIIFAIVFIFSVIFLTRNLIRLFSYLKVAKQEDRKDNFKTRLFHTLSVAFGQKKIFRFKTAGILHAIIFWGFLVLLFSASEAVFQGFYPEFSWNFLGPFYWLISFSTDIFSTLLIIAIIISFIRRYIIRVKRLQGDEHEKVDALIVLTSIFLIVAGLIIEKAANVRINPAPSWEFSPIIHSLSVIIPITYAHIIQEIAWWVHILVILFFANFLPYSKHFHVYTSIQNVFFSPDNIPNKLEKIDFEEEGVEKFGVVDIDDLSWKNIFDSYSCTHCGRCESVCPANLTGKILSPRSIIVKIRERTIDAAPIILKMQEAKAKGEEYIPNEKEATIIQKKFVGDYENIEALWQCTTCGACMQECPITIEHLPAIIGMRRNLVMMEANFPTELQPAFNDLENNGSPWSFPPEERVAWTEGMNIKTCAEDSDFDILFWVGCSGSFDDRAKKITQAFAKLMQIANVNFRILGQEERCNGDVARRTGNEYLADMLVKMNIDTLSKYNVKKIVTICPHCFNTFKNEYSDFGGNYEVIHHSEFLQELINQGKLKIKSHNKKIQNIAFHDSCYLGRFNQIYDAPRNDLKAIPNIKIIEPEKTKDKAFCCGAGGGQMFMEENTGKRINVERTEQLLATGAECIAVNCPFCITMITDGLKDKDKIDEVSVKDIAEILLENIEQ